MAVKSEIAISNAIYLMEAPLCLMAHTLQGVQGSNVTWRLVFSIFDTEGLIDVYQTILTDILHIENDLTS